MNYPKNVALMSAENLVSSLSALSPVHYQRSSDWGIVSYTTAAGRRSLISPATLALVLGPSPLSVPQRALDLDLAASWDAVSPDYRVAANRAGKDFYVYAVANRGLICSANATVPAGYTAATARKIAGFHCLYVDVGTIAGHTLTGFLAGDILPASIWDLLHRPVCDPAGMVYSDQADLWVDIYLQSGTGATTASVAGATITDSRDWMSFVDDLAAVKKQLLSDGEFQIVAEGSNQKTNIAGSADPVITGGHRDTTGATAGTSTSAAAPSTDISAAANPQSLTIDLNGTGPVVVSFAPAGLNTGALIAAALQVAIRAAIPWAGGMTVTYGATYVVSCHGSVGPSASVVISAGAPNDCAAALKLGIANGGVEVAGNLGRRMVSNIGLEDCCGALFQWLSDQSYQNDAAAYAGAFGYYTLPGNKGSLYRQGAFGDVKLVAGGYWTNGASCGSRSRYANNYRWSTHPNIGSRGCARRQG